MDNLEKHRGLKRLFAKKDDRKLLFFYRYYFGGKPLPLEYLRKLLGIKAEILRRELLFFEQMGLVVRLGGADDRYDFVTQEDKRVAELLEEFYQNRREDYEEMIKTFSVAEMEAFLGAEIKGGGQDVLA